MRMTIDGRAIGYEAAGQGPPLVLIHAFPLDRRLWAPQLAGLADAFRVVAVDVPGFGESDAAPAPPTLDAFADAIAGLVGELQLGPALIGGQSMGGYISLALWRRHRGLFRGMVLANTKATNDNEQGKAERLKTAAKVEAEGTGAFVAASGDKWAGATAKVRHPDRVVALRELMAAQPANAVRDALLAMAHRPDSTPLLREIDVPTLVIGGDEDGVTPDAVTRALAEGIPGARYELIKGASHYSGWEQPAAFNAALRSWGLGVGA